MIYNADAGLISFWHMWEGCCNEVNAFWCKLLIDIIHVLGWPINRTRCNILISEYIYEIFDNAETEVKERLWRLGVLFGIFPLVFLSTGIILGNAEEEKNEPRPEFIPYEYMYRRTKVRAITLIFVHLYPRAYTRATGVITGAHAFHCNGVDIIIIAFSRI